MELVYLGIVIFLLALAAFDMNVGVSNQAVNFLSNAVGSKAAPLRPLLVLAAIGLFVGATTSSGMMDVARHGIMRPDHFFFNEAMCVFLAVVVSDIIILDVFNMLGMPTSTTVSMVFELLGGSTAISIIKMSKHGYAYSDLINTDKALSVILGIFLSVAVAFILGLIVMWIARLIFTFNYRKHLKWTIGIFGGIAITSIVFFLIVSGLGQASFMTPEVKSLIASHQSWLLVTLLIGFTLLMQLFHAFGINVLKIIVLFGTFSLAMAFSGNDMVNFIGVPLAGLSCYQYFMEAGGGDVSTFLVTRLNEPANTPFIYLAVAGLIMVVSLTRSKKAQKVINTSVNLSRQDEGEEVFSSSRLARTLVRSVTQFVGHAIEYVPIGVRAWVGKRFNTDEAIIADGAAFDLIRASVNLVLAGLLIMIGTSWQLPLSTTYVAFMVSMGSSLADRAWGRETAVYRITGVISVIGGWFITAGVAFILCFLVSLFFYFCGIGAMLLGVVLVVVLIWHNNRKANSAANAASNDPIFKQMARSHDSAEVWALLEQHVCMTQSALIEFTASTYHKIIDGLFGENLRELRHASQDIEQQKSMWKKMRRKEILGMRKIDHLQAVEKNTWYHLGSNNMSQTIYCLKRMLEPILEHVDNNFSPMPKAYAEELQPVADDLENLLKQIDGMVSTANYEHADEAIVNANVIKAKIMELRTREQQRLQNPQSNMKVDLLYLSTLQETQELISAVRHLLRASRHFHSAVKGEM